MVARSCIDGSWMRRAPRRSRCSGLRAVRTPGRLMAVSRTFTGDKAGGRQGDVIQGGGPSSHGGRRRGSGGSWAHLARILKLAVCNQDLGIDNAVQRRFSDRKVGRNRLREEVGAMRRDYK